MRILLAASVAIVALASTSAAFAQNNGAQNNGAKVNPSLRPTAPVTVPAAPVTRQIVVKGVDSEAPAPIGGPLITSPLPAPIADPVLKAAELAPPPEVKDIPAPAPAPLPPVAEIAPPAPAPIAAPAAPDTSVAVATDLVEQTVKPKVEAPAVTEEVQVVKPVAPIKKKVHKQTYSYDDASYDQGYASGGYGDGCE